TAMPSSISTNGMRVQTGKSIADHVTFGARPVRISHAMAPRPRGVGADPHTGTRGGELENHTGPFTASMTGERGRPPCRPDFPALREQCLTRPAGTRAGVRRGNAGRIRGRCAAHGPVAG